MLAEIFPRAHARFASLPVLGPHLDGFAVWLHSQGYPRLPIRLRIRETVRLEALLRRRRVRRLEVLPRAQFLELAPRDSQDDIMMAATVRSLAHYFDVQRLFARHEQTPPAATQNYPAFPSGSIMVLRDPMPATSPFRSIDIVVPVFNEEACIQAFYERARASIASLPYAFRILFIDDGSRDRTAELCLALSRVDPRVGLLRFSRNFGHQAALTAGLDAADADAVITMDADLQHPPEKISEFIAAWEQGAEIVSGVRANATSSAWKRVTSSAFYRVLNAISPHAITPDSPDFRLFDAKVVNAIRRVREQSRFLRGIYAWVGFRQVELQYDEAERVAGVTHYSTFHMLMFALRAVLSFSHLPLRLATYFGLCVSGLAFLFGVYAVIMNLVFHQVVPGWTSLAVLVSFLSGVQLLTLGVLGEYLGQVLEESKRRPLYLIAETYLPSLRTSVPPPASPLPHG